MLFLVTFLFSILILILFYFILEFMLKIIIIFDFFLFFLNYLNQLFVGCTVGNRSSGNFAIMANFDRPAALDPSTT